MIKKYVADVDKCKHCPNFVLYNRDDNYVGDIVVYVCRHFDVMQLIMEKDIGSFPDWCPLEDVLND